MCEASSATCQPGDLGRAATLAWTSVSSSVQWGRCFCTDTGGVSGRSRRPGPPHGVWGGQAGRMLGLLSRQQGGGGRLLGDTSPSRFPSHPGHGEDEGSPGTRGAPAFPSDPRGPSRCPGPQLPGQGGTWTGQRRDTKPQPGRPRSKAAGAGCPGLSRRGRHRFGATRACSLCPHAPRARGALTLKHGHGAAPASRGLGCT